MDFGGAFVVTHLGCPACLTSWAVVRVIPWTAGCVANTSMFTFNTGSSKLAVGPWVLRGTRCTQGFNVSFVSAAAQRLPPSRARVVRTVSLSPLLASRAQEARRNTQAVWNATCVVRVAVMDVNEAPRINTGACSTRTVVERSSVGTLVGTALTATDP